MTASRAREIGWTIIGGWLAVSMAAVVFAHPAALAQTPPSDLSARVLTIVRAAVTPALPYPSSDEVGELPVDGSPNPLWMVRPTRDGDLTIEVLANPLNASNQARAAKAMVQIGAAIEAAQRRSQASYDRAVAEAKRTGRSQDVDGITLGDEGVAGARIDAEAHVTIEVAFNQPAYSYTVSSSVEPAPLRALSTGAAAVIAVPANIYRDGRDAETNERFCAAETHVFFGAIAAPEVRKRSSVAFEVTTTSVAGGTDTSEVKSVVVSLRGNGQLIEQIVKLADWSRVKDLVEGK